MSIVYFRQSLTFPLPVNLEGIEYPYKSFLDPSLELSSPNGLYCYYNRANAVMASYIKIKDTSTKNKTPV